MKLSETFGVNEDLEVEGKWISLGDNARIRVARFGNPKHRKVLDRLRKPYRNLLMAGRDLPEDVQENISIISMAETILVGWEGIEDEEGNPLEYNVGNAKRVLTEYKDFREFVAGIALDAGQYRLMETEDIAGN